MFNKSIGFLLLAIYLILIGLTSIGVGLTLPPALPAVLALLSGVFILIGR
jgi:hypothetical protein